MAESKISGSLARRLTLIFVCLVIVPLLAYVGFLWWRDVKIKEAALKEDRVLIEKFAYRYLEQWKEKTLLEDLEPLPKVPYTLFVRKNKLYAAKEEGGEFVGKGVSLDRWKQEFGFPGLSFQPSKSMRDRNFTLEVKFSPEERMRLVGGDVLTHTLILLGIVICLGGAGAIWLIIWMSRPLKQLHTVMNKVGEGDLAARYQEDRFGFEINELGVHFNRTLHSLLENMEKAKELAIGREVQNQLLPKEIPNFPGLEIGMGFSPAKEVAGDFYDLLPVDANTLFFGIADGSGKGVSACLYSLSVRSMLRSYALSGAPLEEITEKTNHLFGKDTGMTGNFVTAWLGKYRADNHTLEFTSAGHLPGVLISPEGEISELDTEGVALGASETSKIEIKTKELVPGSLLFLYSDGITEAHNEKGELFSKARLYQFLREHRLKAPQELINHLMKEVDQFAGALAQHDDLTALSVKIT